MNLHVHHWSLKTKVTLSTLIIFLVSIWTLTSYASRVLREDIRQLIHEQQFATVSLMASDINTELQGRLEAVERVAATIARNRFPDPVALQAYLDSHLLLNNLFNGGYFVTDTGGTAIASVPTSAHRRGTNYIDRDHVAAALTERKTTVSKPVIGKKLQTPVVSMAAPIVDSKGTVLGAVVGVVDLNKPNFLSHITDNRYGKTGGYILISPHHKLVVTATDKTRIMQPIPPPGVNPLMDRYLKGFEGSGSIVDSRGVEVLSSSKQVPAAAWVLVARIPTKEAYAPVQVMQNRMHVAAVILSLLAGGLTWWLLTHQLSPVFDTLEKLSSISDSNLPITPLPIIKQDEVGQLISGFNRLIVALADSERFLKTIIDSEPECIKLLDSDGNLLMMNQAGLDMLDAGSFEQVKGKCVCPLITDHYRDEFMALTKRVFQGIPGKLEFETVGLKGRRVWLETHAVPFRNDKGEIVSLLGITRDITERKNAEIEKEAAQARIKKLEGIIPICMYCKKIRDDQNSWNQLEQYITDHSEALFSHGMCPHCYEEQKNMLMKNDRQQQ